ncbi:restriction endonuclease [Vibrio vulnificus]|uniref:restriction endonuclease n=2 Tax=Vibrio vulnificus TaxID=672 RepID=UPI0019D4B735|nr:restriction endonuclease [Vibrio vulnificus]MBN8133812.1 restriction endonuclease [Vibrio vulnificus]MBN8138445.1 restriction endonuclease [Vibrio vulnificus]MBN8161526.1 restriction endonuclease [Vibrio vulnificus]HAS6387131.1 restriction endonuclease [Vibrio vulnificus]HDY7626648.1 restriction endonuclease [Vibrio vulnificus]
MSLGFWGWLKSNLSHLFSLLGIILTIYFSIWYVPQYSEELKFKRIEGVHNELVSTIQELVYNNHEVNEHNIETLISGKEVKNNIVYPFTKQELLIQVQDAFLSNRFIPLDVRKSLVDKVDEIRNSIKQSVEPVEPAKSKASSLLSIAAGIFGSLAAALGFSSLTFVAKRQRKEEIELEINDAKEKYQQVIKRTIAFESKVHKVLMTYFGRKNIEQETERDIGIDFIVKNNGVAKLGVAIKDYRNQRVNSNQIRMLHSVSASLNLPILLVTNSPLTEDAKQLVERLNAKDPNRARVMVSDFEGLGGQLESFV